MSTEPAGGHVELTDAEVTPKPLDALTALLGPDEAGLVLHALTELSRKMLLDARFSVESVLLALHDVVDEAVATVAPDAYTAYLARPLADHDLTDPHDS